MFYISLVSLFTTLQHFVNINFSTFEYQTKLRTKIKVILKGLFLPYCLCREIIVLNIVPWLMYTLYKNEYRIFKPVEITIKRGLK
jgi:hypothetical protein